jgi:uncharacterized radical SAM protein YgiQ
MALIGRLLEAQGYRSASSPSRTGSADAFRALGKPRLYFGITAGNMDSMVNRYTSDRKIRSDDAYTPNGEPTSVRTDRDRLRPARARSLPRTPIVIGSIEASLRRIAHYDYWSDKVRRSVLPDSKADILLYGNAERALIDLTHRLAPASRNQGHPRPARHRFHRAARLAAGRRLERSEFDPRRHGRSRIDPPD